MSLNTLVNYISNSQITSELIKRISENKGLNIVGSSRYAKSIILDSIAKKEDKNILLICPNIEIAYKWIGYFESINDKAVLYYPPTEHLPYASINKSKEIEFTQLTVLSKLIKKEKKELNIVISTERSLQPHLINKNLLIENKLELQKGVQIEIQELANKLTLLGYTKDNVTSTEGFWSRRGEIIDIYPVNNEFPIRLEFFDNVIEKIREYDPNTQKTLENINNIEIIQAGFDLLIKDKLNNLSKNCIFNSEDINKNNLDRYLGIIEKQPSNIIDFIDKETILVIDELEDCKKFANNWYLDSESNFENCAYELNENLKNNDINLEAKPNLHLKFDEILNSLGNFNLIKFYEFESKANIHNRFLLNDKRLNSYSKNIGKLAKDINKNIKNKIKLINIYLPNGNPIETEKFDYKIDWMINFNKYIKELIDNNQPIIIGGDFNVIPNDEDVYSPENFKNDACAHPLTREKFRNLLNLGFVDTVKYFVDGNTNWTFWGYRGGNWQKGNGLRIDHFLTTPEVTDLIKSVNVNREPRGWEKASDHTPVTIELIN